MTWFQTGFSWLVVFTVLSSIVYTTLGAIYTAPYWLFDGLTNVLSYPVLYQTRHNYVNNDHHETDMFKYWYWSLMTVQIGFLLMSSIMYNRVMNPFNSGGFDFNEKVEGTGYGVLGSAFVLCSIMSLTLNFFNGFFCLQAGKLTKQIDLMEGLDPKKSFDSKGSAGGLTVRSLYM